MTPFIFRTTASNAPVIARAGLALVLFPHGAQKLTGWFGGPGFDATMKYFTETAGLPWLVGLLVIILEFFGPIALLAGLATRLWSLGIAGMMTGILLTQHNTHFFMNWFGNQPNEGMEYFLLAIALSASLVFSGAGKFSIDSYISNTTLAESNSLATTP